MWRVIILALALVSLGQAQSTCGGPDTGGVSWISSRDPLGPPFTWVDIHQGGNSLDTYHCAGPMTLPFPFSWYGQNFTQFWTCPEGLVLFQAEDNPFSAGCPPFPFMDLAIAGAYFNYTSGYSLEMDWQDRDSLVVVQFTDMEYMWDCESTWQLILHEDGRLLLNHLLITGDTWVGWEGFGGSTCLGRAEFPDSTTYLIGTSVGDMTPPVVSATLPHDIEVDETADYAVSATISDASGLGLVFVVWEDSEGLRDSLALVQEGLEWTGVIPRRAHPGWIRCWVQATDRSWHPNTGLSAATTFVVAGRDNPATLWASRDLPESVELSWSLPEDWENPSRRVADFESGLPEGWFIHVEEDADRLWTLDFIGDRNLSGGLPDNRRALSLAPGTGPSSWLVSPLVTLGPDARLSLRTLVQGLDDAMSPYLCLQLCPGGSLEDLGSSPQDYFFDSSADWSWNLESSLLSTHAGEQVRLALSCPANSESHRLWMDDVTIEGLLPQSPAPGGPRELQYWELMRNGQTIVQTPNRFWRDEGVQDGDSAYYTVRAIYDGGTGPWSDGVWAAPSPRPLSGGPDGGGYRWDHGDAFSGPTWEWLDFGAATLVSFDAQGLSTVLPLGFSFPFYGVLMDQVRLGSHGALYFEETPYGQSMTTEIPYEASPNLWVAAWHNDRATCTARVMSAPDGAWAVEFSQLGVAMVQLRLYGDGHLLWCFGQGADAGFHAVGLEDEGGTRGTQLALGSRGARLGDHAAIRVWPDPSQDFFPPSIVHQPLEDMGTQEGPTLHVEAVAQDLGSEVAELWMVWNRNNGADADSVAFQPQGGDHWLAMWPVPEEPGMVWYHLRARDSAQPFNERITPTQSFMLRSLDGASTLSASRGERNQVSLNWSVPANDGARNFVGYRVRRDGQWLGDSAEQSFTDRLENGAPTDRLSVYTVSTLYDGGEGADSAPSWGFPSVEHGPDPFGYTWSTSDEAGGPSHQWEEIQALGTEIPLGEDDCQGPFPIGFTFDFFGTPCTQLWVHSCGLVAFTNPGATYSVCYDDPIPSTSQPNAFIAPFWDHLDPSRGGEIYRWQDPAGQRLIIEYHDVLTWAGTLQPHTFQLVLHASGDVEMRYQEVGSYANCAAGMESHDGLEGLFHFRAGWEHIGQLHDNLTVRYHHPGVLEECVGVGEAEPNNQWSQARTVPWEVNSVLCGSLSSATDVDWWALDSPVALAVEAQLQGGGANWELVQRLPITLGGEQSVNRLGWATPEKVRLEGFPGGRLLLGVRAAAGSTVNGNLYRLDVQPLSLGSPCDLAEDLGVVNGPRLWWTPPGQDNSLDLFLLEAGRPSTLGKDAWVRLESGVQDRLRFTFTADSLGDEALAIFSSCGSAGEHLLALADENGFGLEGETVEVDAEPGQEFWLALDLHGAGRALQGSLRVESATALENPVRPPVFSLLGNHPNPFNPSTTLAWEQALAAPVEVRVWNLQGREVACMPLGQLPAGRHQVEWTPQGLASGVYLYEVKTGSWVGKGRMVLLK